MTLLDLWVFCLLYSWFILEGNTLNIFFSQFSLSNISNTGNSVYFLGGCLGVSELSSYLFIECFIENLKRKSTIIIS